MQNLTDSLRAKRGAIVLVAAAIAIPLLFAALTGHVWEDFYITFRSSRNLAAGHGLVFEPGERVHSFTSPLGVLIPAFFALLSSSDSVVIWLFRVFNAAVFGATVLQWYGLAKVHLRSPYAWSLLFGLLLLDAKIVAFTINGMETPILLFFLTLAARELLSPQPRPAALAFGFGGLMWSRPDGFLFFGAVLVGSVVFVAPREGRVPTNGWIQRALLGLAGGLLIYLPWLLWAWWYYGSPLPNTILAKSEWVSAADALSKLIHYPLALLFGITGSTALFEPIYSFLGGWPQEFRFFSKLLVTLAAYYFLIPGANRHGRLLSLSFFLGGFYLQIAPPAPWYYQAWQVLAIGALAFLVDDALAFSSWLRARWPASAKGYSSATRIGVVCVLVVQAAILGATGLQLRVRQDVIEDGVRKHVGLWLRENASPGDRVFLEPLGYIGYFSQLKMLDYPGLSAPEVAAVLRANGGSFARVIPAFWPEWLVLRPREIEIVEPETLQRYQVVKSFDERKHLEELNPPGRGFADFDAAFFIYRRIASVP